jgi:hypothetical protein
MNIMSTTIRISRDTKKLLENTGHKGETFDMIVRAGAIALANERAVYKSNVALFNGHTQQESYIEIRVPKCIRSLAVDKEKLASELRGIMEENNIEEIDDPRDGVVF